MSSVAPSTSSPTSFASDSRSNRHNLVYRPLPIPSVHRSHHPAISVVVHSHLSLCLSSVGSTTSRFAPSTGTMAFRSSSMPMMTIQGGMLTELSSQLASLLGFNHRPV